MRTEKTFIQKGMIDSHLHLLEMENRGILVDSELRLCKDKEVYALLDVGLEATDLKKRLQYRKAGLNLLFACEIFPSIVTEEKSDAQLIHEVEKLKKTILESPQPVSAIGECGLEMFHPYGHIDQQKMLLEAQIALANELHLPIIIHNREATKPLLELLEKNPLKRGGIMHCYSADLKTAYHLIDQGFKISFAGNITYKNSLDLRECASKIPATAILLETDSPFLTPQPVRKEANTPNYIGYTYDAIAKIRNRQMAEIIQQVKDNFQSLFEIH